jgi:hypothetical protein
MTLTGQSRKDYSRQHYLDNKEKYHTRSRAQRLAKYEKLNELKRSLGPCIDCGETFHPCAMDFDHVNDDKVAGVSSLVQTASWQKVLAEIAKCDFVCSNCHRVRTWNRLREST